ncbi:aminopeptidase N [Syntrophotalea acetylenivorans]|uniref:Aminopeptidase N n=1 Tax=Syntrophotalea acetylenivorans TaxID=1842532 RepID=A0A1L3GM53_9BACT|nr:aminopeptidase N [Syntrophotalea acetylenivorans]APG26758.1 aminopeptidase N [Syntrophotalea acetylenivorans]
MAKRAETIYLKDYTAPAFWVDSVDLHFELGEEQTRVASRLALRRRPDSPSGALVLDGDKLELEQILLDGRPLAANEYLLDDESLTVLAVPESFVLETTVVIRPQDNTALEGLYRSGNIFCTQCEAEGFRKITYFFDRPDVMSRFTTTIVADKQSYPVLLSNGNCIDRQDLGDGRHSATWQDPFAKPCYLFALVSGDLGCVEDRFTTCSGREVALEIYVEKHNLDKCAHAMHALKKAMRWDEETYGLEYDLDIYMIVAVDDFNMGAMENKGLNIFNSKYVLARPETATDADFQAIEGVIAHEYFHNWTGNRVTCRDWFQLSLKEGLTVFRDQHFSSDQVSRAVKRIEDVCVLRTHQFAEDTGPLAHAVRPEHYQEINNFYTVTVYNKGAELVRMLQTILGPDTFIRGVRRYLQHHDGQAATVEDFLMALREAGNLDLQQFQRWYSQAGTPQVSITSQYLAAEQALEITFEQFCPATPGQANKQPLHIPCKIGMLDTGGQPLTLQLSGDEAGTGTEEMVLHLRQDKETLRFINLPEPPVLSLFRQFSAPIRFVGEESSQTLAFLLKHDSDSFNRWDAGQRLAERIILNGANQSSRETAANDLDLLAASFASILQDDSLDKGLAAKLLELPNELYLALQMQEVDVEGIHTGREQVRKHLAVNLRELFRAVFNASQSTGDYSVEPEAVGRRSLKNRCLWYLDALDTEESSQLVADSYRSATNMTDRIAALMLSVDNSGALGQELLGDFYRRAENDPLVLDKWFAVQARSSKPETLASIKNLLSHSSYQPQNPNRVRALIGTFSRANPLRFHVSDGSGYALLAEQIIALDPVNPQLAGYLAGGFSAWRRYDEGRRKAMQQQLQRIVSLPKLSRDLSEVVTKMLE